MADGVFISFAPFLSNAAGGVQACTREYLGAIAEAGVSLSMLPFAGDRRFTTRLARRFYSSPYLRPFEPSLVDRLADELSRRPARFVFLNQVAVAGGAERLRRAVPPSTRLVLLSHGAEITDLVHLARLHRRLPLSGRLRPTPTSTLRAVERAERACRAHVDAVITLSPFDAQQEREFGSQVVEWLPRVVESKPLEWRPIGDRLGFVGTLDHAPNLEGLVAVLDALKDANTSVVVRVASGDSDIGRWLVDRYEMVDYLGFLPDAEMRSEASSWSAFLHPIFCSARGCSTKLAMAMGWRIPILTTPHGRRGYVWREGSLIEAATPREFAKLAVSLLDSRGGQVARSNVISAAESSPSMAEVATKLRKILNRL